MSRYDEVKEKAATIFPYKAMGEAALKQGDARKALDYACTFEEKARELLSEYNILAAAIVYLNASQFLASIFDRFENSERTVYHCHWTAMLRVVNLLEEGIDHENCCQLLLSLTQSCLLSFNALIGKELSYDDNVGAIMYTYANIYFLLYHKLAQINPDNVLVKGGGRDFYQQLEQCGYSRDSSFPNSVEDSILVIGNISSKLNIL